jgi:hypothetical protein
MGSRTSPPCEEYVVWFVAQKVMKIGSTALTMLKKGLSPVSDDDDDDDNSSKPTPNSSRVIQPTEKRVIYFYSGSDAKDGDQDDGHWEMLKRKVDKYYYVDGDRPTSVPNSFVVSQQEAEFGNIPNVTNRRSDRFGLENLRTGSIKADKETSE